MEMETEDDVDGNADPPSSVISLVIAQEFQSEIAETALTRKEELIAI